MSTRQEQGSARLSDTNVHGRTVVAGDGRVVGEIVALFIDDQWRVESVQVKLRKDVADQLGISRGVFHAGEVEIPIKFVQSISDTIILSVAADELRNVLPDEDLDAHPVH